MAKPLSKYAVKDVERYKNLTYLFSILMMISLILGQVFRDSFAYAYAMGWALGGVFAVIATISSMKGKAIVRKKRR